MKVSVTLSFVAVLVLSTRAALGDAEDPLEATERELQLNLTEPHVAQTQHDYFVTHYRTVTAGAPINTSSANPSNSAVANDRIVNGVDADPLRYRSFARLTYRVHGRLSYLCGGVLISDRFVLTAAHCIWNMTNYGLFPGGLRRDAYGAAVGLVCDEPDNCGFPFVSFQATHYWSHPKWDPSRFVLDIALVRLSEKVPSDVAVPVVPDFGDSFNQLTYGYADNLKTVGFGWIGNTEQLPTRLQVLNVGYMPTDLCEGRWGFLNDGVVCVYTNDNVEGLYGRGLCFGDSGSPTVIPQTDGPDIVVGVTSFGATPCAEKRKPDVLARVSAAARYIANVVCYPGMSEINPGWCFEYGWRTGVSLEPDEISFFDLSPYNADGTAPLNLEGVVEQANEIPHDMTECAEDGDSLYAPNVDKHGLKKCRKVKKKPLERQRELCGDGRTSDAGTNCCNSCIDYFAEERQASFQG